MVLSRQFGAERRRLGKRLREAREYLGFSQEEAARHLGMAPPELAELESGQSGIEAPALGRLARLYQQPVTVLIHTQDDPQLPEDIAHLARRADHLTDRDRHELARFADFLNKRAWASRASRATG